VATDRAELLWTGAKTVTAAQALSESLFLGLRLNKGVDFEILQGVYGRDCLAKYESGVAGNVSERACRVGSIYSSPHHFRHVTFQ